MKRPFLAAALAVAAGLGFTTPAAAQPDPPAVVTPDPPPIARRVADLERENVELKARVTALEKAQTATAAATCPPDCGCSAKRSSASTAPPAPARATLPPPPLPVWAAGEFTPSFGPACVGGSCSSPARAGVVRFAQPVRADGGWYLGKRLGR